MSMVMFMMLIFLIVGARVQRVETMTLEEIFVAKVEHSREEVGV